MTRPARVLKSDIERAALYRQALETIARGETPPEKHGHYLQARAAVKLARAALKYHCRLHALPE